MTSRIKRGAAASPTSPNDNTKKQFGGAKTRTIGKSQFYTGKVDKDQVIHRFIQDDEEDDQKDDTSIRSRTYNMKRKQQALLSDSVDEQDLSDQDDENVEDDIQEDHSVSQRTRSHDDSDEEVSSDGDDDDVGVDVDDHVDSAPSWGLERQHGQNQSREIASMNNRYLDEQHSADQISHFTSAVSQFDKVARVPLSEQIKTMECSPQTLLGPSQCNLTEHPGTFTLVDSKPPPFTLRSRGLSSPDHPKVFALKPSDKYVVSAARKSVYTIPKWNDATNIFLLFFVSMFFIVSAINMSSFLAHEYRIYNTAPYVEFNQYVLDNYTIKNDGLGTINNLLRSGPTFIHSLRHLWGSMVRSTISTPDLEQFIAYNSHNYATNVILEHNLRLKKTHPNYKLSPTTSQVYHKMLDLDQNEFDMVSPFYSRLTRDYGLCAASTLDIGTPHFHQPRVHGHRTPAHLRTSLYDRTLDWVSRWRDMRNFDREYDWQEQNKAFIYTTLLQFINTSLFTLMVVCAAGVWKDLTAYAVIKVMKNKYIQKHFPYSSRAIQNDKNKSSFLSQIDTSLNSLPLIPQALARASLYGVSFCSTWASLSFLFANPIIAFTATTLISLIWFRFCADPDRIYESILVTYGVENESHDVDNIKHANVKHATDSVSKQSFGHDQEYEHKSDNDDSDDDDYTNIKSPMASYQSKKQQRSVDKSKSKMLSRDNRRVGSEEEEEEEKDSRNDVKSDNHAITRTNRSYQLDTTPAHSFTNQNVPIIGLGYSIFRRAITFALCAFVIYSCIMSYSDVFNELAGAPSIHKMSPTQYSDYISSRLNPKFIGSTLLHWGRGFKDSLFYFFNPNGKILPILKHHVRQQANEIIDSTREKTEFTFSLAWTFIKNLFSLRIHSTMVTFIPRSLLPLQHQVSPQDFPAHMLHICYVVLSMYIVWKVMLHMRNAGYIGSEFLSPFVTGPSIANWTDRQKKQQQLQHQPSHHDQITQSHFSRELKQLRYDDGLVTSILQIAFVAVFGTINYMTGGVILPLSYYAVDQIIQTYREFKRYQNRDLYVTRPLLK